MEVVANLVMITLAAVGGWHLCAARMFRVLRGGCADAAWEAAYGTGRYSRFVEWLTGLR